MKYKTRSEELKAVITEFKKTNSINSLIVRMRSDGHKITPPTISRWLKGESNMLIETFDLIESYINDLEKGNK